MSTPEDSLPSPAFRFQVDFRSDSINPASPPPSGPVTICHGAFSEITGLEATMEPKAIQEGGRNLGALQRNGPVYFSTVVMKRGMTTTRDLWLWFSLVNGGLFSIRLAVTITMFDTAGQAVVAWELAKALPIKFKAADLNARGTEIAIEEIHLIHEGLTVVEPTVSQL